LLDLYIYIVFDALFVWSPFGIPKIVEINFPLLSHPTKNYNLSFMTSLYAARFVRIDCGPI